MPRHAVDVPAAGAGHPAQELVLPGEADRGPVSRAWRQDLRRSKAERRVAGHRVPVDRRILPLRGEFSVLHGPGTDARAIGRPPLVHALREPDATHDGTLHVPPSRFPVAVRRPPVRQEAVQLRLPRRERRRAPAEMGPLQHARGDRPRAPRGTSPEFVAVRVPHRAALVRVPLLDVGPVVARAAGPVRLQLPPRQLLHLGVDDPPRAFRVDPRRPVRRFPPLPLLPFALDQFSSRQGVERVGLGGSR